MLGLTNIFVFSSQLPKRDTASIVSNPSCDQENGKPFYYAQTASYHTRRTSALETGQVEEETVWEVGMQAVVQEWDEDGIREEAAPEAFSAA